MRLLLLLCLCLPVFAQVLVRQEILVEKAPAAKVMEFLAGQYRNVQFTPHPSMNGFYAYGSRKDILQIKSEVPNLDRVSEPPPPPVSEWVLVRYGDIKEMKALLSTLVPDVEYEVDAYYNRLRVTGSPAAVDQVKELVPELDRATEPIVIDVKVIDLTASNKKMLGLPPSLPRISVLPRLSGLITSGLQFLVTQSEAKVLAAPRVGTESAKPALIRVGDRVPLVALDPVSGEFTTDAVDVGIDVTVTPTVGNDDFLDLGLEVKTSAILELVSGQYACPEVRKEEHRLRVHDGDTVVTGNLIPEEFLDAVNRIPLLADLPITGTMFRSVRPSRTHSEVVMMLTPHITRRPRK